MIIFCRREQFKRNSQRAEPIKSGLQLEKSSWTIHIVIIFNCPNNFYSRLIKRKHFLSDKRNYETESSGELSRISMWLFIPCWRSCYYCNLFHSGFNSENIIILINFCDFLTLYIPNKSFWSWQVCIAAFNFRKGPKTLRAIHIPRGCECQSLVGSPLNLPTNPEWPMVFLIFIVINNIHRYFF